MSIFYRLKQNNIADSKMYGKWYGKAVHTQVVSTAQLASIMQENCTVKYSDIQAVIAELVTTMKRELLDSKRVKINGLGSFKVSISSRGADSAKEYNAKDCVKRYRILFQPEVTTDEYGRRTHELLRGAKAQELPKNDVDKGDGTEETPDAPAGGDDQNP